MSYRIAGIDVHKKMLAVAVANVEVDGDQPLFFQWLKNGTNLTDGGRILGAASNVLTISSAATTDSGSYSVIVSNSLDTVSSDAAQLTVVPAAAPGTRSSAARR